MADLTHPSIITINANSQLLAPLISVCSCCSPFLIRPCHASQTTSQAGNVNQAECNELN